MGLMDDDHGNDGNQASRLPGAGSGNVGNQADRRVADVGGLNSQN